MLILIHIHPGTGPVGAWRIADGTPVAHYTDPTRRHRAEAALANRGPAVPWDDWFHQLADRTPYLDDYEVITVDNTTPEPLITALRIAAEPGTG